MIKRNDLAKQFELVVQQEIINHNKVISANNIKMNGIHGQIESLKEADSKNNERIVSKLNTVTSQLDDTIKYFQKKLRLLESATNDINKISSKDLNSHANSESKIRFNHNYIQTIEKKTRELFFKYSELDRLFTELHSRTNKKLEDLEKSFIRLLELHKEEIKLKPNEIIKLENKVNKKFEEKKCDIQGNREEMEILKKKNFVLEKRIERLETHIDRLEGK